MKAVLHSQGVLQDVSSASEVMLSSDGRPGARQWQYGKPKLARPEALVAEVTSASARMGIQMSVSSGALSPSWSQPLFVMIRSPVAWQNMRGACHSAPGPDPRRGYGSLRLRSLAGSTNMVLL